MLKSYFFERGKELVEIGSLQESTCIATEDGCIECVRFLISQTLSVERPIKIDLEHLDWEKIDCSDQEAINKTQNSLSKLANSSYDSFRKEQKNCFFIDRGGVCYVFK